MKVGSKRWDRYCEPETNQTTFPYGTTCSLNYKLKNKLDKLDQFERLQHESTIISRLGYSLRPHYYKGIHIFEKKKQDLILEI